MRVLFLTEQFPYPLHDGGNLRTYHILRGLARRHEVWLVSHEAKTEPAKASGILAETCLVTTVREPRPWRRMAASSLRKGSRRWPLFVLKNWSRPLLAAADRLLAEREFDAIHFNMLDTACYCLVRDWPQRKVFDTHNYLAGMAADVSGLARGLLKRAVFAREARLLERVERAVGREMDCCLACSKEDATQFEALDSRVHCAVVSNGVDTDYYRPRDDAREEPGNLVFIGAMGYFPNEEGARYFVREVLPLLHDKRPAPRLFLVGSKPSPRVQALHDGRSVIVTGRVEDVRPYLERAQAVVVPLQTGGGTRLKILEAFAMGKAVVSTSKGAEGIPAVHEEQLLLADSPEAFAGQVARILDSQPLRRQLGHEARRFVETHYGWPRVQALLLDVYERLAAVPSVV